jgi:hypothetical protein
VPAPVSASVPEGVDPVEMSITAYATAPSIRLNVAIKLKGFFPPGNLQAAEISAVAVEHGNRFRPASDWRPMTKPEIIAYNRQEAHERAEVVAAALERTQQDSAAQVVSGAERAAMALVVEAALVAEKLAHPVVVAEPRIITLAD